MNMNIINSAHFDVEITLVLEVSVLAIYFAFDFSIIRKHITLTKTKHVNEYAPTKFENVKVCVCLRGYNFIITKKGHVCI
jgi:hypothetical protein